MNRNKKGHFKPLSPTQKIFNQPCYHPPIPEKKKIEAAVGEHWSDATSYYLMTMDGVAQYDRDEREQFEIDRDTLEKQISQY